MSLRSKITLAAALIAAVLAVVPACNSLTAVRESRERELFNHATTNATLFALAVRNAVLAKDSVSLREYIVEILQNPEMIYARILDENNNILAEGGSTHALQRPFQTGQPFQDSGADTIDVSADISRQGIRMGQVQLGLSTHNLRESLTSAHHATYGILALEIVFILGLCMLLSSYLGRWFNQLSEALQHIAAGEFGFQLPWRGNPAFAQIASSFNQMSNSVRQLYTEVHEEEIRKGAILDAALDCIITMDQHGLINEFNAAAAATFGYSRRQISGKPAKQLIAPAHRSVFSKSIAHYLATGKDPFIGQHTEIAALRADQTEFPAEIAISVIRLSEQPIFTIYLRDITERKQAEGERQRLMMAVEASPDSIFITDTQGLIRYVNPAFTTITGWAAAEIIGKPPGVLKSDQMATGFYAEMWANLRQGKIWSGRILKRRKKPSSATGQDLFWAQSTIAPIQSPTGELQGYVAVERDITEAVQREERAFYERESAEIRARVSQILQSQQPLQDRFAEVLQCIAQLSGLSFQNKGWVLLHQPETDSQQVLVTHGDVNLASITEAQRRDLQSRLYNQGSATDEIVIADDSQFNPHSGYYAIPMQHAGNVSGFVVLLTEPHPSRDTTRIAMLRLIGEMMGLALTNHRLQEEMEKARLAAEDAARTKSQFLANMSHEIRTPMYGVMGMLDLLNQENLTSSQREYVNTARSSARLLLSIIDDILDFSRIEAGELHLEHIDFDVRQILENVTTLLAERAHRKHLELTCFIPAEIPASVRGDPTRLQQVLTNLVGNAIKFTEQGEVAVSVQVGEEQPEQVYLCFQVRDTGIGIAPEAQARLFKPFSQADGSTSRRYGGTGLGLVISRQLVELMGGQITFASQPKEGTTFRFTARFDHPTLAEPTPSHLAGVRILTVEDNLTSRTILEYYLQHWGVIHDSAGNGHEALEKLRQMAATSQPYQIAVLDWQMPGMDGPTLVRAIRDDARLNSLRLVVLTSLTQTNNALKNLGCQYYLTKPVRQSHLYDALLTVLSDGVVHTLSDNTTAPSLPQLQGTVLLVEDNEVNQVVELQMLKQLGLQADLVTDGQEAIEAVEQSHYDVVLMDCQMPQIDGLEATRTIRAREQALGRTRTPIIALTASAMKDDRDACLAAGMDGYLAKPFEARMLGKLLAEWLPAKFLDAETTAVDTASAGLDLPHPRQSIPSTTAIDALKLREIRALMGPNFAKLVEAFVATGDALVEEMYQAATAGDTKTLINRVHRLKGSSGNVGATELFELCRGIEEASRRGQTKDFIPQVERIAAAHLRVCKQLQTSLS